MALWRKLRNLVSACSYAVVQHPEPRVLFLRALRIWQAGGLRGFKQHLLQFANDTVLYARWVACHDTLDEEDKQLIARHIGRFRRRPLISVLMPVSNTPEVFLKAAIDSVQRQIYPNWELCIADDASTLASVRPLLEAKALEDSRIRVVWRTANGHICAASNSALELARGEFLALLDHDDELAPHALYMVAAAVEECAGLDMLYSDEDKIDRRGRRVRPYFKPGWNPDLLLGQNYVSHLSVFRTALVRRLGGFRLGLEGCQDWDLTLRVAEATAPERIRHIPHILYHWRVAAGSTAGGHEAKPYVAEAAIRTVTEHLARTGLAAQALAAWGSYIRVRRAIPQPAPRISIIVPTRNSYALLRRCVSSIFSRSIYRDYELLIVDNQSDDPETLTYIIRLAQNRAVRVLHYDAPFNFAAIINFAVEHSQAELICLLNNDTEVISPDWLGELASHAVRPEVGAVGAMLYYPDESIQHAGVIMGMGGVAGHWHLGAQRGMTGYFGRAALVQDFSAVTAACMMLRRCVFDEVGGMDAEHLPVAYNDIDLCLRIRERGYRIVWTPYAELYHHESASRGKDETPEQRARFSRESSFMQNRWSRWLANDPAYNPNLSLQTAWPYLAKLPRGGKPWRIEVSKT